MVQPSRIIPPHDRRHAEIPFKKPKNVELTDEQKIYNFNLSKNRIKVENFKNRGFSSDDKKNRN
ncbi:MAG: hypothetical protein D3914_12015 [Candidatus Electrothrix sp. LOE2]|nr:hypothetical protein [Candidatus Electrothrix sp. LOE2]